MSTPMPVARTPHSRRWQFSLFTLLLTMTCVGLACVALISPSELWKGLVFVLAAGSLLVAGLCIVYRDGRSRAFAVGFVIFGSAYFVFSLGDTPDVPVAHTQLPTTRWGIALYTLLHGANSPTYVAPAPWPAVPVTYAQPVSTVSTLPPPLATTTRVLPTSPPSFISYVAPATPQFVVPLAPFLAVVHHLLVLALGVLGGIVAQILHSTRRQPSATVSA